MTLSGDTHPTCPWCGELAPDDWRPVWLRWHGGFLHRLRWKLKGPAACRGGCPLPPELERVLRDPTITIDRDHEITLADGRSLFEHIREWRDAPSNTPSADTGSET